MLRFFGSATITHRLQLWKMTLLSIAAFSLDEWQDNRFMKNKLSSAKFADLKD